MEKTIYKSKNVLNENGEKFTLFYWLLSREVLDCNNNISTIYGIEITKYSDGILLEENKIECISDTKNDIWDLISVMADGNVTPMALVSIVDDYISCKNMAG